MVRRTVRKADRIGRSTIPFMQSMSLDGLRTAVQFFGHEDIRWLLSEVEDKPGSSMFVQEANLEDARN